MNTELVSFGSVHMLCNSRLVFFPGRVAVFEVLLNPLIGAEIEVFDSGVSAFEIAQPAAGIPTNASNV